MMNGSDDTNVSVSEIQRIKNDLKSKNFSDILMKVTVEKRLAQNASMLAKDLLNKTMMLSNLVHGQNDTILNIIKTFLAINKGAQNALYAAGNGSELIGIAKLIDFQVGTQFLLFELGS